MCFTAIPGSNGQIRGAQFVSEPMSAPRKTGPKPTKPTIQKIPLAKFLSRRPIETVPVFSGERQSMSYAWVRDDVCRVYRCSRRGQAARKRQHKPCWRTNYIEHFDNS